MIILRVDRVGDQARLGPGEIASVHAIARERCDNIGDGLVQRLQRNLQSRHRVGPETRVVEGGPHVIGARRDGDFLLNHERAIQQARLSAAKQMGQQFQRLGLAGRGGGV